MRDNLIVLCMYCNKVLDYRTFSFLGVKEVSVDTCTCDKGEGETKQ